MVKVISSGRCKQYRCTCNVCGCIFEYNNVDVDQYVSFDENTNTYKPVVICPECHNRVLLLI